MQLTPLRRSNGFVLPPRAFKGLAAPNSLGLKARFSPLENVPTLFDYKFLADRFSPKRDAAIDKYSRMLPNSLRWRVISAVGSKAIPKAVVRSHLKHIWGKAFAECLWRNGYHANGRKLLGPEDGDGYVVGLKGTLEILVFSNSALFRHREELVKVCDVILKALERQIRRSTNETDPRFMGKGDVESDSSTDVDVASSAMSLWTSNVKGKKK